MLSTRTLEIFRELGLEHDVRRLSSRMYELRDIIYATSLTGPELGRITIYDPESTEAQLLQTLSPTRAANLSQHVLGQLLWDQLEARQAGRVPARQRVPKSPRNLRWR